MHSKEWHTFFTKLTNVSPNDWIKSDRKDLFYKFELYQHWTYKYFLQSFPEFEERIVEIDKLSRQDRAFREKLNNHYMTYKWCGLKGDKSVADYIKEQLPRVRKYLQDRKIQKEREKQNRICQQKIKSKKQVRELFLNQADEIDIYKRELVENPCGSINESFCSRNQKRVEAIQEAINNNFKISIQRYELTDQTTSLLKQHNIDAKLFYECVGNAIQQEIHQEFIDVLHNGAKLYCEKTGLPGVAHFVSEDWFGMLGDMSVVGAYVNVLGRYSLAHTLSDICQGIYSVGKKSAYAQFEFAQHECVSIESIWDASVDYVKWALKNSGDAVVDFTEGVQQKAFVRPARLIAEFAYVLQNDPEVVFEKATNILIGTAQYVLETTQLLEALTTAPFSEQTQQLLDSFEYEWAGPFRERAATAARIFWEVPLKEKAQEAVAIGLQVFAAVGAAKLLAALPDQAALLKTSALLKLDQLSQMTGPVMQTGVAPDGTVNIALHAVEQMSEELVAVVEESIAIAAGANVGFATMAVADAVSTVALAVRDGREEGLDGGAPNPGPFRRKTKVAREQANRTRKLVIRPSKEIIWKYKKLAGREIEWDGTYNKDEVQNILIPKKLIFSQKSLEHVFSGKVSKLPQNGPLRISGYHSDFKGKAVQKSGMNMTKIRDPKTGVFEARIRLCGKTREKTMFSEAWKPKEVLDNTCDALKNIYEIVPQKNGRILFLGKTTNGINIEIVVEKTGEVVTFYPVIS